MKYDHKKIESKWRKKWLKEGVYDPGLKNAKKPFYNLMMFPYPSAEGLHVGNMYAFTGSDIYGRFKRMQGYDVFEPIGLDGFGIHSENYAIKIGRHPAKQAQISEKNFYRQLAMIGNGFAWNERLETYDPEYYRWTQWIFVQLFKNGLAYRKKSAVNWCPSCLTVLADEQVIQKSQIPSTKSETNSKFQISNSRQRISVGVCERCETPVIKKELEQWFFRITKYADKLLKGLDEIDWSEKVKVAQRNWIGKSEGATIKFPVVIPAKAGIQTEKTGSRIKSGMTEYIEVFTTRPDTLFGATYMVVAPEHEIISNLKNQISNLKEVEDYIRKTKAKSDMERADIKQKSGVKIEGLCAINPATKKEISIYTADFILAGYGTGAVMSVPAHDERDFEFASAFNIPVIQVVKEPARKSGVYIHIYDNDNSDVADEIRNIGKPREHVTPTVQVYEVSSDKIEGLVEILRKNKIGSNGDYGRINKGEGFIFEGNKKILDFSRVYTGDGVHINSEFLDGLDNEKASAEAVKWLEENNIGKKSSVYRLRDWLISRQRYWGPPIPLIFCYTCKKSMENPKSEIRNPKYNVGELENPGWFAAHEKDLPVKLPDIKNFRPTGTNESPLASDEKFYKTKCPKCGGPARRETDVSDTFLDSAWYYIGYLILKNSKSEARNPKQIPNYKFQIPNDVTKKWLPVDMYIGGAEHSVLHLLYVRFLAMVLKGLGLVHFGEPFKKFRAHGLLIKDGAKMSKSKGNVINPDDYIKQYGADGLRMYLMFLGPFDQGGDFRDSGISGITRFLQRVWVFCLNSKSEARNPKQISNSNSQITKKINQTIKKVTEDIENLRYNTAISALMILLNEMESNPELVSQKDIESFLKLLAPFAPHMSEEIWQTTRKNSDQNAERRGKNQRQSASNQRQSAFNSIHLSEWPKYDPELIKEDEADIVVQINGKVRAVIKVRSGLDQSEVEKIAKENDSVKKYLTGEIKKVISVKDKLINFVV